MTGSKIASEEFILRFLEHVVFDGWSRHALDAAATDLGMDQMAVRAAAPNGLLDMVRIFSDLADLKMIRELEYMDINRLPVRDKIKTAVRLRLQQNEIHKDAIGKMLSFLVLPGNSSLGAKCVFGTVDKMWRVAGDNSIDFNYYTKRGLLAGVYSSTVLYWLSDGSEAHQDTWGFLDRRIENVLKIPKIQSAFRARLSRLPSPIRLTRRKCMCDS